jgi:hypothetical protein
MHIRSRANRAKAAKEKFKLLALCKLGALAKAYFSDAQNPLSPSQRGNFADLEAFPSLKKRGQGRFERDASTTE